jgi:hypothetical protein
MVDIDLRPDYFAELAPGAMGRLKGKPCLIAGILPQYSIRSRKSKRQARL